MAIFDGIQLGERLAHAWNAFTSRAPTYGNSYYGPTYSLRPDRPKLTGGTERTIISAIYTRLAVDAAAISIKHVRVDQETERYIEVIKSGLNACFQMEANIDQTGRSFVQDIILNMIDEGVVAVVPVDTTISPIMSMGFDIDTMRVGKIVEWRPKEIRVRLYNDHSGKQEDLWCPKRTTAIIENPFYAVMNEPNSTLQRLKRKLALLDLVDEQSSTGKLDMIIQLPYTIKSPARRQQAEQRRKDIEMQLTSTKYGIAYTDGTEKVMQLNRSLDNQLLTQIESLTETLYSQLGLTKEIMNGTADEKVMNNYYSRTIEPLISAVVEECRRKFLSKTARTQGQTLKFFMDPFKLVPTTQIAEMADKMIRNQVMTSNEFRQTIGLPPSDDPNADQLRNPNISQPADASLGQNGEPDEGDLGNGDWVDPRYRDLIEQ